MFLRSFGDIVEILLKIFQPHLSGAVWVEVTKSNHNVPEFHQYWPMTILISVQLIQEPHGGINFNSKFY